MQTRPLTLYELETAYGVLKELRSALSYDEFEDLIYAMRHQAYTMHGVFEDDELITYAGVSIQTNLTWKRHLFIYDLVTKKSHRNRNYGKEMLFYLHDIAKISQCEYVVLTSEVQCSAAHRFYEAEGFEKKSYGFIKNI